MKKKILYFSGIVIVLALVLWLSFGFYEPRYNDPLTSASSLSKPPVSMQERLQDDQTLLFVALSGGGTRAAAMSWKTLEELKKIPYTYKNREGEEITSTLADEIDYISGISGGSFAAAAWCLFRDNMDDFRKRFIEENIQLKLAKGLFIPPWQGLRLISRSYDRINMASELYDRAVFDHKTFGDLPSHPILWIHATNLALGNRFTYSQEYFDLIKSDLLTYPIGYGCAASSAFPILLSPITVKNYGTPAVLKEDKRYAMAKRNSRRDIEKDYYCGMREFFNDKTNKYIHLADGGLVDNQGLQSIIDQFGTNGIINKKLNDRDNPLKRLIIINVNAGVRPDDSSSKYSNAPHINSVIKYTMITSMDILSAKRWMEIKRLCSEVNKAALEIGYSTGSLSMLELPYTIEISFRNIEDDAMRAECYDLPTSFYLNEDQINLINRAVPVLVEKDPDMIRLKQALYL
ncbi:MAG: patatin-like phospholipase family protein [bacterium]